MNFLIFKKIKMIKFIELIFVCMCGCVYLFLKILKNSHTHFHSSNESTTFPLLPQTNAAAEFFFIVVTEKKFF